MHSWSPPVASNATTAMSLDQSMIGFEVKVLLDGIYMAYVPCGKNTFKSQIHVAEALSLMSNIHGLAS